MDLYEADLKIPRRMGFASEADMRAFFGGKPFSAVAVREAGALENTRHLEIPAGVRWIRLAENHGSGWRYRSSARGEWKPVARADDGSMVLENKSAGEASRIDMEYEPPLRKAGFIISGSCLLFLLGLSSFVRASKESDTTFP